MYTRKHFVSAASDIRMLTAQAIERRDEVALFCLKRHTDYLVRVFESNPHFDEQRFRAACNPYDTGGVA